MTAPDVAARTAAREAAPKRIQRKRTRGWRMPEGAVYVGRGSDWGNPYRVGDLALIQAPSPYEKGADYVYGPVITREIAVLLFRVWVAGRLEDQIRQELAGRDLACWCPLSAPCHADVLLEIANAAADLEQRVQALAGELESFTVNRTPAPGSYDAGVVAAFVNAAARLRRLLADAAPHTEETA